MLGGSGADRSTASRIAAAIAVATAGVLPVFLTGSLIVELRADLRFGSAALGVAVFAFFATSAAASAACGRLVERVGARRGMRMAALGSAASLLGIALLARSWGALVALLVLGGLANAVANPATHLFLAGEVRRGRQGLAFGIKQAAAPAATLIGGIAAPILALTPHWRLAFVAAGAATVLVAVLVPGSPRVVPASVTRPGGSEPPRVAAARLPALVLLSVGAGCGTAAAVPLGSFLVSSSVAAGLHQALAGALLAAGSVASLVARVLAGWFADRRTGRHLLFVALLLLGGAGGFALLASGLVWALVVGTVIAFGAAWGWPGLLNLAVVEHNRQAPAAATGVTQTGSYAGSALGPLAFGIVAEHSSYAVGWLGSLVLAVAAAAAVLYGRRAILRGPPAAAG